MFTAAHVVSLLVLAAVGSLGAKPDLYYAPPSPPSRIVLMTASVLGADINLKMLDIAKGEQLKPEFLKINPQHTVPTLDDNGFVMSESRPIQIYLAQTHPNGESLYPREPQKQAIVNEMLYFDIGRLYRDFLDLYRPILQGKPVDECKKKTMDDSLAMLEEYLTRREWVAGDNMSLADLSILSTVSTLEAVDHDLSKFPRTVAWLVRAKISVPDYQTANQVGLDHWTQMFEKVYGN